MVTDSGEPTGGALKARAGRTVNRTKPRLFTPQGASDYVDGVRSKRWFEDRCRAAEIDCYKLGGGWAIPEYALLDLLEKSFIPAVNCRPRSSR